MLRFSRILVLALLAAGALACADDSQKIQPPAAAAQRPANGGEGSRGGAPITVDTVEVKAQRLADAIDTTGELKANEEIELRSEASGRVVSLNFREGQEVEAQALLVKINDADLQAELRRAEVRRALAWQREQRVKKLLDAKTVSQEVFDEAIGERQIVDAEIELLQARIQKTEIRAPFAGRIGLRSISEGGYVTAQTPIATLQDLDPIKLDFQTPEKYVGKIAPGMRIEFSVAGDSTTYAGEVYAVEPRIDPTSRSLRVRARAPNPGHRLFPGAFAKVRANLGETDALLVPTTALVPGLETNTVFIFENGKAAARQVQIGRRTDQEIQILEGLKPGDRVIVSGLQQIRPGTAVVPR